MPDISEGIMRREELFGPDYEHIFREIRTIMENDSLFAFERVLSIDDLLQDTLRGVKVLF